MRDLIEIKNDIRTINPMFSDELLDLLCEYINCKNKTSFDVFTKNLKADNQFENSVEALKISRFC